MSPRCENEKRLYADRYNSCRNRHCQMPGAAGNGLARRARGRVTAGAVFPHVFSLRPRSPTSPIRTRPRSTTSCSKPRRDPDHLRGRSKHLGARIGVLSVLHTWGRRSPPSACHMIVPAGGKSLTASAGSPPPGFFLPVRVLSRLFRRLVLRSSPPSSCRRTPVLRKHAR